MLSAVIKQPDINNLRAKGFDLSYSFRDAFIHHQGQEDIAVGRKRRLGDHIAFALRKETANRKLGQSIDTKPAPDDLISMVKLHLQKILLLSQMAPPAGEKLLKCVNLGRIFHFQIGNRIIGRSDASKPSADPVNACDPQMIALLVAPSGPVPHLLVLPFGGGQLEFIVIP